MGHISGGAAGGIGFGVALFVLVSISLTLWWRRVHRDHYSKDPNSWGGSWGVKAMQEAQARMDAQNDAKQLAHLKELERQDIELAQMESQKYHQTTYNNYQTATLGKDSAHGSITTTDEITRPNGVV